MFWFEDRRQKLKGFFGISTVKSKHGHSNVYYRSVFSGKYGTVTLHTVALVLDLYIKSYYGVNWHKLNLAH